jgi:mono/diheme cytochrome c family protein
LLLALVCALASVTLVGIASAQDPTPPALKDPLALGAWLYEGQCVRCHGPYERERVGRSKSSKVLAAAIEDGGCQIRWGRNQGGPLARREIKALVEYMLAWEELGGPPPLPDLPPQPTPTPTPTRPADDARPSPTPTPTALVMDERTRLIAAGNEVAHGAWLYTQYCYRCHQAYADTRMGRGARETDLKKVVENGKTATQMTAFSRAKGGPLKAREIAAILTYIAAWERLGAAPALPEGVLVPPTPDPAGLIPIALPVFPAVEGGVGHGAVLYAVHCRRCHGEGGRGGLGPRLARTWQVVRADLRIRSAVAQGVAGSPMRAWTQANDGPLTEQAVDDLAALIVTWSTGHEPPTVGGRSPALARSNWQGVWGMLLLVGVPALVGVAALLAAGDRPPRC